MPLLPLSPRRLLCFTLSLALTAFSFAQEEDGEWSEFDASVETVSPSAEYESPSAVSAAVENVPFRRRIMREDVTIRSKTLRLGSGKKVRLVYGIPKKAKNVPAVFVLDVETNALANASSIRSFAMTKKQQRDYLEASYLLRSPFGSNMLGNGFAVAYIVADDLETLRSARTPDWIGIFDRVRDLKAVDGNNVFLFSTREYANLSVYLTSRYNFSGFILEEPGYLLFSNKTHEDVIKKSERLSSEEIWRSTDPTREFVYEQVFSRINTPIMLIRNPDSNGYAFSEKTLISKLNQTRSYYETIEVRGIGRDLTVFGGSSETGVIDVTPKVSYYAPTVSKWVSEIIAYMRINSSVDPVALRDPSNMRSWK
ncbi:hypothetical protein [Pelagicoccus sp. SDUM812005]|uniref:hypothetical protein n=1 Tax=Pelagicoccus sp. SDUM812005 TaxID=3041257 RepID=UPI0028107C1A|nr:hypothetical protein [Pelagicoccus sp. SDUM812005]MDQ8182058.1 hypothetical protein [Pelagicoccus sp. SDUM812005]